MIHTLKLFYKPNVIIEKQIFNFIFTTLHKLFKTFLNIFQKIVRIFKIEQKSSSVSIHIDMPFSDNINCFKKFLMLLYFAQFWSNNQRIAEELFHNKWNFGIYMRLQSRYAYKNTSLSFFYFNRYSLS